MVFVVFTTISVKISYAQISFSVKIIDAVSGEVVTNAHISVNESAALGVTNKKGEATIQLDNLPVVFTVSHLSYHSKDVLLQEIPAKDLKIKLVPATRALKEVTVKGSRYQEYFKKEIFYVHDFEFDDNLVWVTGYPGKNITLDGFAFVSNVMVNNGRIYFTHQSPLGYRTMN